MKHALLITVYWLLNTTLLTACIPSLPEDGSLSFQTIEQKNDSAYSLQEQYTALEPGLVVIDGEETLERYEVWFGEKGRGQLRKMRFGTQIALAVFQGWQTTGGYGVKIERITRVEDVVTVVARFDAPDFGSGEGAITSPYHLVRVSKAGDWQEGITFELVVAGEVVAVFPTPEP